MTDIVKQMKVAVQAAVESMPYQWIGPNYGVGGVEIYDTLREFFEGTWQGDNADEVFKDAAAAAVQAILPFIETAKAEARREMREDAAQVCEAQAQDFLSEEYAVDQPLSSSMERFACKQCAAAIRNLGDTPC